MIIPVRCFTCNNVIGDLWEEYLKRIQLVSIEEDIKNNRKKRFVDIEQLNKKTIEGRVLDELGIKMYCCRRMILSNVDMCEKI